ncbi:hypothetical protein AVEN_168990-1 [Araneus ventricosus]|uniref:Uncharacterized protein n=1 Tax=Araneus ventricosus TaxID=182803 RepID=A0A4Y2KFR1_ARAVE|nr:hypothetical protein AVEN_168990-1 [Araneus ventricosus]
MTDPREKTLKAILPSLVKIQFPNFPFQRSRSKCMRDVGRQIKCVDGRWDLQAVIGTLNLRSHLPHPPTIPSPLALLFRGALSPFLATPMPR